MAKIMVSDVPFLVAQWDFDKNTVSIDELAAGSHKICHWRCPKCGYEWETTPKARYAAKGKCPCCDSNKVIVHNVNDAMTIVPELKEWYDKEKNDAEGIDISTEGLDSSVKVWWYCKTCGRSWVTRIRPRLKKMPDGHYTVIPCPHYNTVKRKKDEVPSVAESPDLIKFWDFFQNKMDPASVPSNSTESAHWICQNCKYEWDTDVRAQSRGTGKCACCELGIVIRKGYSDMFTKVPELKETYDFEKNEAEGIDPYSLGIRSTQLVWWKCQKCGHSWRSSVSTRVKGKQGNYSVSGCQQCYFKSIDRITSIASIPNLMKFWDPALNPGIDCNITSAHSRQKMRWHCKECNYTWDAAPNARYRRSACPCCDSRHRIEKGYNDLLTIVPDIEELYDYEANEANGIDIYTLGAGSSRQVHWHCPKCGRKWISPVNKRVKIQEDGIPKIIPCSACSSGVRRTLTYAEEYPELAKIFNEELNSCKMSDITSYDSNTVLYWWTCATCHHDFTSRLQTMIVAQKTSTKGCPYCSRSKLHKNDNSSFGALHPDLLDEYGPDNTLNPHMVFPNDKRKVEWICRNNPEHQWFATFAQRHLGQGNCPICNRSYVIADKTSFAAHYPEKISMWSPKNTKTPQEVFYNASPWFRWICPTCNQEFGAFIKDIVDDEKEACPFCDNRRVSPGYNSLLAIEPEAAKMWSPNNDCSADEVFPYTSKLANWICPDCGGEFSAKIRDVVDGNYECPFCADKKVLPGFNSLLVKHEDIAKMWSPNNGFSPDEVVPHSAKIVNWICPDCGGEFSEKVRDVVDGNYECPFCADRKVLPGFNSFKVKHSDLMDEWYTLNNYVLADPDQIGDSDQTPVWWICKNNPAHHYRMSVSTRLMFQHRERESCPICKGLRVKLRHFV